MRFEIPQRISDGNVHRKGRRRERRGAFERAQQRRSDDLVSAMERRKIRDKYRDLIVLTEENDGSAQLDDPDKVRSLQAS